MNVLLELKKRLSPIGKHRFALTELKKLEKKYPDDPLLKECIRAVKKKIFLFSESHIRRRLINLYISELGISNKTTWNVNDIQIKSHQYPDYQYIFVYEYIDIVLSDLYLRQKVHNLSRLSNILSCFPQEGPYQWKNVRLKEGDIIIDAGSNIGLFSLFASKYYNCQCYAFEPSKKVLPILEENINSNNLDDFIHICPYGLSNTNGTVTFNIHQNNIGGSSMVIAQNSDNDTDEIQCVSLDSWAKENNITRIDFIKADIEGAERLLLQGATYVLQTLQPKISICTYHFPDDKQVLTNLIKKANPNYKIMYAHEKLYAYIPNKP